MEGAPPYESVFESTLLTQPDELYDADDFITTATGNKVSRASKLQGQHQIHLHGKVSHTHPTASHTSPSTYSVYPFSATSSCLGRHPLPRRPLCDETRSCAATWHALA